MIGEGTIIQRQHNLVFVLHLFALLLHSMPWPLRGLLMHHGIHAPRVPFAAAPRQIKGLVSLSVLSCGVLGLAFEWWP